MSHAGHPWMSHLVETITMIMWRAGKPCVRLELATTPTSKIIYSIRVITGQA